MAMIQLQILRHFAKVEYHSDWIVVVFEDFYFRKFVIEKLC